jgi:hypothetical protein
VLSKSGNFTYHDGTALSDRSLLPSLENDRDLRGDRFAPVVIQHRAGNTSTPLRDLQISSLTDAYLIVKKLRWSAPLPLPGSRNSIEADATEPQSTEVSGRLIVYVKGSDLEVEVTVKNITLSTSSSTTITLGTYGWGEGELPYPLSTVAGDVLEVDVGCLATSEEGPGIYGGLIIVQPPCTGYDP